MSKFKAFLKAKGGLKNVREVMEVRHSGLRYLNRTTARREAEQGLKRNEVCEGFLFKGTYVDSKCGTGEVCAEFALEDVIMYRKQYL